MVDDKRAREDVLPVVLFDGVCNLCNAAVLWLIERDGKGRLRYASLESEAAYRLLAEHLSREQIRALPDAMILVDEAGVHTRSTAALRSASVLGWPWKAASAFLAVPPVLRDAVYRFVARNRYRWFGTRDTCMIPTPEVATRFLDADDPRPPVDPLDRTASPEDLPR
jgi:predicted DCC family thiol-disulfide oxidoreductase YuxK